MNNTIDTPHRGYWAGAVIAFAVAAATLTFLSYQPTRAQSGARYDDVQIFAVNHGGTERTFGLYVPRSYVRESRGALIVAIHGRFSSAKALHGLSRLRDLAEARGAVLLYPEIKGAFWDDGGHAALGRKDPPNDDMGFIAHVIDSIATDYALSRDKIYVVGHDSGAAMAMKFACTGSTRPAGIAAISALMWQYTANFCSANKQPTSMLFVHGRLSEAFPPEGKSPEGPVTVPRLSARAAVDLWRNASGCGTQPSASASGDSVYFANCAAGTAVAYVGVESARQDWPRISDKRLNKHGVDATSLIDKFFFERAGFHLPSSQGSERHSRDYLLYVSPRYDPAKPTPLILMLHGRPSSAAEMARISDMNSTAARNGFIVAYPEGLNNEWNAQFDLFGKSSSSVRTGGKDRPQLAQDDVGFLKTLAADLQQDFNIDPKRMFVSGFSNGGFMTLRMACSASDTFAGFAEVGAALYNVLTEFCKTGRPAPVLFMHGTHDPSISIDGVKLQDPNSGSIVRVTLSVKESVAFFARKNGCKTSGVMTTFGESGRSPGTSVQRYVPKDCLPEAPIIFYIIEGGGHTWPGVPGILPEDRFGKTNMDINASDKIWEFFSTQRLPG